MFAKPLLSMLSMVCRINTGASHSVCCAPSLPRRGLQCGQGVHIMHNTQTGGKQLPQRRQRWQCSVQQQQCTQRQQQGLSPKCAVAAKPPCPAHAIMLPHRSTCIADPPPNTASLAPALTPAPTHRGSPSRRAPSPAGGGQQGEDQPACAPCNRHITLLTAQHTRRWATHLAFRPATRSTLQQPTCSTHPQIVVAAGLALGHAAVVGEGHVAGVDHVLNQGGPVI